jgi:hypothetical protein
MHCPADPETEEEDPPADTDCFIEIEEEEQERIEPKTPRKQTRQHYKEIIRYLKGESIRNDTDEGIKDSASED